MRKAIHIVEHLLTSDLGVNRVELARLDATEIDEHVEKLEDKQIDILENYMIIDENQFAKSVKNILESYDTITNDEGLSEEIVLDILGILEIDNEKSRKAIS